MTATESARAARFGALLAALWAAHDVADHLAQTDHQATHKAASWRAMAGHVGSYTAVQLLALGALRGLAGVRPSRRRLLAAVALSAGTHAFIDRRWPVVELLRRTGSPYFASTPTTQPCTVDVVYGDGLPHVDIHGQVVPLPGPYLADQALHHGVLALCAAVLAGDTRRCIAAAPNG